MYYFSLLGSALSLGDIVSPNHTVSRLNILISKLTSRTIKLSAEENRQASRTCEIKFFFSATKLLVLKCLVTSEATHN